MAEVAEPAREPNNATPIDTPELPNDDKGGETKDAAEQRKCE